MFTYTHAYSTLKAYTVCRRKAKSEGDLLTGDPSSKNKKQRRPEIGIKIHVPDFSSLSSEKPM